METFHENIAGTEKPHSTVELTNKQKKDGLYFGIKKLENINSSLNGYKPEILEEYGLSVIQEKCEDLIALIKKDSALFENVDLQDKIGNFEPCVAMLEHIIQYPQKEKMKESLKKEIFNLSLHLEELLSLKKDTIH